MGGKFGQIPFGNFRDDIIERGLEAGSSGFRNSVGKFGQCPAEGELGSSICEGVASGFRGKSTNENMLVGQRSS